MYLINGNVVEKEDFNIPVEDMLVWRGDGIFEAIKLHDGFPFGIDLHLDRLSSSAEKLNLDIDIQDIRKWIIHVSSHFQKGMLEQLSHVAKKKKGQIYTCFTNLQLNIQSNLHSILRKLHGIRQETLH